MANGRTRRYADTLANLIDFNAAQKDSLLVLDKGIAITRQNKFRNQRVIITVYVPVVNKSGLIKVLAGDIMFILAVGIMMTLTLDIDDEERGWDVNVDLCHEGRWPLYI